MARRSAFSLDERRAAVERAFGGNERPPEGAAEVASDLGVSAGTLYRWAREVPGAPEEPAVRETLVAACQRALRHAGYGEVTIEAVASDAGVSKRAAYHYFPTKEDLFAAAIDDAGIAMARGVAARWRNDTDEPALDRLGGLLAANVDAVLAQPQAHVLFRNTGVPRAAERVAEWDARMTDLCRGLLTTARGEGELRPDLDLDAAASILLAAARGILGEVTEGEDADVARRLLERLPDGLRAPGQGPRAD